MRSAVGLLAAAFLFGGVAASAAELTASAEDAREILFFFARFDAELGYCADKLGDAKTFSDARDEWVARNSYLRDMALNLLAYLKASPNGDILADEARDAIAAGYAGIADVDAACRQTVKGIWDGFSDISEYDPQLVDAMYQSDAVISAKKT